LNQTVIINPNKIPIFSNLSDLRKRVKQLLVSGLHKEIKNIHTRFYIQFNGTSFKKLVSGNVSKEKLIALTHLWDIVENGVLYNVKNDKKNRSEIICIYYFFCFVRFPMNSENKNINHKQLFRFTVRQQKDGKLIYSGGIDKIKYPD
jgi:hypothetical protein